MTLNVDRTRMDIELLTRDDAETWVMSVRCWAEEQVRAAAESEQGYLR